MKRQHKPRLLIFEIVLDILLFSILCCFSIQFLEKAHTLSEESTTLLYATEVCSDVANLYQAGDGSLDTILNKYDGIYINEHILIYLDKDFASCKRENGVYYLLIEQTAFSPDKIRIHFYELNGDEIYDLVACHYSNITPEKIKEGNAS